MMPVRNVERWDLREKPAEHGNDGLIVNAPDGVANAVSCHEVVDRRMIAYPCGEDLRNAPLFAVSQKDKAGMRVADVGVTDAIRLFVRPREFMHFDDAVEIVVNCGAGDDANLLAPAHGLFVNIQLRFRRADKRSGGDHQRKPRFGLLIDLRVIRIGLRREVNFGARDMQKRIAVAPRQRPRFVGGDDIVGRRGHFSGEFRRRAVRSEWKNSCHNVLR